ncbi:MAG: VCBS repeat-containing protein, partial [Steroidobacteraceae bacterium]|nr:VCBS repeat-containing protein [Steroidobacteraceae bacterium]
MRNDALDRFCLDGNKLRLFSGTYGAAGSEYRTEVETFARIRAYGTAGNGPAYFVVERKDGRIDEYGNSATSRIESLGQSTARAWALSKTRDRAGNEMTLNYIEDTTNGSYRIDSVTYGGNPGQGVAAAYEIKFNYQTKPSSEIDSGYIAGSLVKEITRLASVVVSQDATAVRSYTLTYEGALSSTSRSRLASVQECAGADCLAPTLFTYQNGSSGLNAELGTSAAVPTAGYAWPLDVNGDGREDLVYSSSTTSGGGTWMVMFANASGGYDTPFSTGIVNTNFTGAIAIDYDANGRGDLLVPYSGGTWWVLLGSPSGLAAPVNTGAPATTTGTGTNARALDLDGDGLQDLLWADLVGYAGGDAIRYRLRLASGGFSGTVQTLVGPLPVDEVISSGLFNSWANRMPSRAPDFNGDGRADLVYRHTLRFSNTLAPPEQTETDADAESNAEADSQAEAAGYNYVYTIMVVCQGGSTFGSWSADAASAPYFGDFNGDGKSDILYYDSSGTLRYRFSRGTSFASEANAGSILPYGAGWVVLDWDGDGYDDVLLPHTASGTWHLMRSTGETLAPAVSTGLSSAGSTVTSVTDHNGDGLHDLAYSSGGTWRYRSHAGPWPDLLLGATDGFGNALNFTYASLSNYVYYTRESTATYPTQEYQGPLYVVANVNASNGIGGTFNLQSFYYQGARIDLQGRGFLGFAYRSWIDSRDGTAARRSYRQDFPFIGAITNARRTQEPSGTVVTEEDTIYASHPYGSGWETRRLPYVSRTTRRDREAGGPYNGALLRTVVTDNLVDANTGTRYDSTRTTTEGATANGQHGGGIWTERVYHPTLFTDTAGGNWCVGRPASTQETRSHTMTGGTQQTRQVDTTWNGTYCRPTQTVLQPGDPQWQV